MFSYIVHRLLVMIPTLLAISALIFLIIQLPPGDYLETLISEMQARGEAVDLNQIEALRKRAYGLDKIAGRAVFLRGCSDCCRAISAGRSSTTGRFPN